MKFSTASNVSTEHPTVIAFSNICSFGSADLKDVYHALASVVVGVFMRFMMRSRCVCVSTNPAKEGGAAMVVDAAADVRILLRAFVLRQLIDLQRMAQRTWAAIM